jgi:hypothetical protein
MKHLAIALALGLTGCATALPPVIEAIVSAAKPAEAVGDKIVVEGTRGLILAHNAAQGGIALVNPLVRNRVLTAAQVNRYEAIINRVEALAVTGRTTLTVAQRSAEMFNLADELNKMAGR